MEGQSESRIADHTLEFDEKQRILLFALHGDVTETSLLAGLSVNVEFLKKNRIRARIIDFSNVRRLLVSGEFVRTLAISDVFVLSASDMLRVIVAPQPSIFGLARMFGTLRESVGKPATVVRDMPEALKFLNVDSLDLKPVE